MKRIRLIGMVVLVGTICLIFGNYTEALYQENEVNEQGEKLYLDKKERPISPEQLLQAGSIPPEIKKTIQSEYAPGEAIVKFKPDVVSIPLEKQKVLATEVKIKESSIQALNQKYGLIQMERVFKALLKQDRYGQMSLMSTEEYTESIRQKFPQRAGRAPKDAKVPDLTNIYKLTFSKEANIMQIVEAYKKDPNVEYAQPNYKVHIFLTPNDPYYSSSGSWGQAYEDMWGLHKIQMGDAWDIEKGSSKVIVAVVDTGIDYNHEDLADNVWINSDEIPDNGIDDDGNGYIDDVRGWDFFTPDNDPMDDNGHGTHCAGTIAAVTNNAIGVAGISWYSKIMAVKGLDSWGSGWDSDLANCIIYAADNGADVLSMSWGGYGACPEVLKDALDYAYGLGSVLVAAAGNSSADAVGFFPANYKDALTVAATDPDDKKASFSNYGLLIDVSAPGVDILSLRAEGTDMYGDGVHIVDEIYYRSNGTSMACPHVAGLAALILSRKPSFTNEEVKQILRVSADDIEVPGFDFNSGYGRINAYKALQIDSVCTAKITSPRINDVFKTETIEIRGSAFGPGFQSYKLEYSNTQDSDNVWTQIGSIVYTPVTNGILGNWDTTSLNSDLFYLRLTVVDNNNREFQDVTGPFYVAGKDMQKGWPIRLGVWCRKPVLDDLDNDGDNELVIGTHDGYIHVFNHDGSYFPGNWPKKLGLDPTLFYTTAAPAIADLDGDGNKEIIVEEMLDFWGSDVPGSILLIGRIHVLKPDGTELAGWPKTLDALANPNCAVSIGDIDNDGDLEIIVGTGFVDERKVYALHHNGDIVQGWPVEIAKEFSPNSTPVLADLDGDGYLEIIIGCQYGNEGSIEVFHYNGEKLDGFPFYYLFRDSWEESWARNFAIAAADTNRDGEMEIFAQGHQINRYGKEVPTWSFEEIVASYLAVAQVDSDARLKIICGGRSTVYVLDYVGEDLRGWPVGIKGDLVKSNPVVGDIDGDGDREILIGAPFTKELHAWHHTGGEVEGFPKITLNEGNSNLIIADFDNDGDVEVISANDIVYVWDLPDKYNSSTMEWPMFQHDPQHTGCYPYTPYTPPDDITPPTIPLVTDEGKFTNKKDQLYCSWKSEDKESGISEYQYVIFTKEELGDIRLIIIIRDWTSTGATPYVTASSLKLGDGKTYYFGVTAKNGAGLWSEEEGYSDGITVDSISPSITNKTQNPQYVGQPILFKAQVSDDISGVKEVLLEIENPYQLYPMSYNPQTGLYEVTISALEKPSVITYKIVAYDNVRNKKTIGPFELNIVKPNQPPIARILRIQPNPAYQGQMVYFFGDGKDKDGYITEYSWRSSIDGFLSNRRYFSTNKLSVDTHTIYFKVKDDKGAWSKEVERKLFIRPRR